MAKFEFLYLIDLRSIVFRQAVVSRLIDTSLNCKFSSVDFFSLFPAPFFLLMIIENGLRIIIKFNKYKMKDFKQNLMISPRKTPMC